MTQLLKHYILGGGAYKNLLIKKNIIRGGAGINVGDWNERLHNVAIVKNSIYDIDTEIVSSAIYHDFNYTSFPNDLLDADTGNNYRQNHPVLDPVQPWSGVVTGSLNTRPAGSLEDPNDANSMTTGYYLIELYGNDKMEREVKKFLGAKRVFVDDDGNANFSFDLNTCTEEGFISLTATATSCKDSKCKILGSTSEVSEPVALDP